MRPDLFRVAVVHAGGIFDPKLVWFAPHRQPPLPRLPPARSRSRRRGPSRCARRRRASTRENLPASLRPNRATGPPSPSDARLRPDDVRVGGRRTGDVRASPGHLRFGHRGFGANEDADKVFEAKEKIDKHLHTTWVSSGRTCSGCLRRRPCLGRPGLQPDQTVRPAAVGERAEPRVPVTGPDGTGGDPVRTPAVIETAMGFGPCGRVHRQAGRNGADGGAGGHGGGEQAQHERAQPQARLLTDTPLAKCRHCAAVDGGSMCRSITLAPFGSTRQRWRRRTSQGENAVR